jgi:hypothetical protein
VFTSPKCLAPKNASVTAGTVMVLAVCDGSTPQTFTYASATGDLKDGSLCLEVPGASTADSVQLALNSCNGKPEQNWSWATGATYTPDAPVIAAATTTSVTGTSCADCTVKVYKSTGAAGASGPTSTLLGTVTATANGAFSYAPGGSLAVGNKATATATTPLGVVSAAAVNVALTR